MAVPANCDRAIRARLEISRSRPARARDRFQLNTSSRLRCRLRPRMKVLACAGCYRITCVTEGVYLTAEDAEVVAEGAEKCTSSALLCENLGVLRGQSVLFSSDL